MTDSFKSLLDLHFLRTFSPKYTSNELELMQKRFIRQATPLLGQEALPICLAVQVVKLTRYQASKIMEILGLVSSQTQKDRCKKASQEHSEISNQLSQQFAVTAPAQV